MTSDIETRLRNLATDGHPDELRPRVGDAIFREAADKISHLNSLLADAAEALKPMAAAIDYTTDGPDNYGITIFATEGAVRLAAEVLKKMENR